MASREPFEDAWDRLERARSHSEAFYRVWKVFLKSKPYRFLIDVELSGEGRYYVKRVKRLPQSAPLHLGEMLYQLRAALDSFIYDATVLDTGQDPPPDEDKPEFPICRSQAGFDGSHLKIAPLRQPVKNAIEKLQTYNAPAEPDPDTRRVIDGLAMLNDLARRDRHRRIHVVGGWHSVMDGKQPTLIPPTGVQVKWFHLIIEDGFFDDESEIARFGLEGWKPTMKVGATPNLSIGPEIMEARTYMPDLPLDNRLLYMRGGVAATLTHLAQLYGKGVRASAVAL